MSGIIGKKLGMGQIFREDGTLVPVTFLLCEDNEIVQIKNSEKDNASAVVLGAFPLKKPRKTKKFRVTRQFILPTKDVKKGDKWTIGDLGEVTLVKITGVSKGKGFQGQVKRYNFGTARDTHGTKQARHGSTGACVHPNRTKKGLKMAGHMGNEQVTTLNREIINIDPKTSVITIKGPVPGAINSTVVIKI